MTLEQFQHLRHWHLRHQHDRPLEAHVWTLILTLWMVGWVGAPTAWLLRWELTALLAVPLVFAPGSYVAWRERLHRRGTLRCDWLLVSR